VGCVTRERFDDVNSNQSTEQLDMALLRQHGVAEVRALGLLKAFGATTALADVDFVVKKGEVHALIGMNGSGKSTLIKILAGVHRADAGEIEVAGQRIDGRRITPGWSYAAGLRFVHQDTGTFPDHTVAENFALGSTYGSSSLGAISWPALNRRVAETLRRFELDVSPAKRMGDLSRTTQTLIAIARALDNEEQSSVLVLDEPTASLPPHEVNEVYQAIRHYVGLGHTVVLVSHRVDDVLAVASHATFLRDGRVVGTQPVSGLDERTLISQIAGPEVKTGVRALPSPVRIDVAEERLALSVRALAAGAVNSASFDLHQGEILGISGLAGSGRSALLRGIAALTPRRHGEVVLKGTALPASLRPDEVIARGIVYVPENRTADAAFTDRSVRDNLHAPRLRAFWHRAHMPKKLGHEAARRAIERYQIKPADPETTFAALSGGNQQKVVMARWLDLAPEVILLDEPTQGVDVGARAALHAHMRDAAASGAGILVVSSDVQELAALSDRVIGMKNGRTQGELRGSAVTVRACVELAYGVHAPETSDRQSQPQLFNSAEKDEHGRRV
jgi:ABC-type sugar transport system, ATPase component